MTAELIEVWRKIVYRDDGPMDARLKVSRSELRRLFEAMDVEQVTGLYWCAAHGDYAYGDTTCFHFDRASLCDMRPLFIRVQP